MDNATAIKQRAQALIQRGAYEEAMAEYSRLLAGDATDPGVYILMGDLSLRAVRREDAVSHYVRAADGYDQLGLLRNAIAVFKKVLRVQPRHADAHQRLADLYARKGLLAESVSHVLDHAALRLEADDEQAAREVLEQVTQLSTPSVRVALRLADLYLALGERGRAVAELQRLARDLEARGRPDQARKLLAQARLIDPRACTATADGGAVKVEEETGAGAPPGVETIVEEAPRECTVEMVGPAVAANVPESEPEEGFEPGGEVLVPVDEPGEIVEIVPGLERAGGLFELSSDKPLEEVQQLPLEIPEQQSVTGIISEAVDAGAERSPQIDPVSPAPAFDGLEEVEEVAESSSKLENELENEDQETAVTDDENADWIDELRVYIDAEDRQGAEGFLLHLAREAEDAGDGTGARRLYERLWEIGRRDAAVAGRLADMAEAAGDNAGGARWLAEVAELDLAAGEWDAARQRLHRVIELDPDHHLARRRLERLDLQQGGDGGGERIGNGSEAGEEERDGGEAGVVTLAGDPDRGELEHILTRFRHDIGSQLADGDHAAHYDLAVAYVEMDLLHEALAELKVAQSGSGHRHRCLELQATCYSRLGQPQTAAEYLRVALEEIAPADAREADLCVRLGTVLMEAGDHGEARRVLREVIDRHPAHEDARQRLEALGG